MRDMLSWMLVGILAALASAAPAFARVWTVGETAADFTEIQPAIDAASDGDVVLVRDRGEWQDGFYVDNKAISVIADADVRVLRIWIGNLAADKEMVLAGFKTAFRLYLDNNQGSVRLHGHQTDPNSGPGPWVLDCGDIALVSCSMYGGGFSCIDGRSQFGGLCEWELMPNGLTLWRSGVALYDCYSRGTFGCSCDPCDDPGDAGGPGLQSDGFVFASNSRFYGGPGENGAFPPECLVPAPGGSGGNGILLVQGAQAPPHAEIHDCVLEGGLGGGGVPPGSAGQPISGPSSGTINQIPGQSRSLQAPILVNEATVVPLTFVGAPGDQVTLRASTTAGFEFSAGDRGVNLLGQPYLFELDMGVVPSSGTLTGQLTVPDLGPGVENANWYLQARMTSETGQSMLSGPATLVILASTTTDVEVATPPLAGSALGPNHPNPFSALTRIPFSLDREDRVTLTVSDVAGRRVATILDQRLGPGNHLAAWDGRDAGGRPIAAGIYYLQLTAANRTLTQRSVILR